MLGTLFSSISSKIIAVLIILLLSILSLSYWYFTYSQSKISQLTVNVSRLESAIKTQEETIAAQSAAQIRQNEESLRLQQTVNSAESRRRELERQLRARNSELLARTNPQDFERRINQETSQIFRNLESITRPSTTNTPAASSVDPSSSSVQPPANPPRTYQLR